MSKSAWPIETGSPESVGLSTPRLARIGEVMKRHIDQNRIAGVITLVAKRGKIAHLERFGHMNLETKTPMAEDAIFRIYSMSKIVTSVATLMLMEDGHFILKDPVKKWLPGFADLKVAATGADGKEELVRLRRDITIHDLLTHLAGLTYDLYPEARDNDWTLEKLVSETAKRPLRRQPGLTWDYSISCDVLGRLIEVISGRPYDVFLKERIFAPLGMTDTDFWVPPEKAARLAEVYTTSDDGAGLIPSTGMGGAPILKKPGLFSGGGGLVSTTSDYLRFALAILAGAPGPKLLSPKSLQLMASDHLPPQRAPLDVNERSFGLGVSVVRQLGECKQLASIGEFGWGGAACTQVWIDPAEQMITMLMLQHFPKEKFSLMDLFKQAAYQAILD